MAGRLRLLGQRVLARHAPTPHVGGLRLAQHVVAARTPERIVESSTRLARGRSIATPTVPRAAESAAIPKPAGMTDFAARWIFGDGPPEGIPIAGEATLAEMAPAERPSFLVDRDARTAQEAIAAKAETERRSQRVPRGRVDEVSSFKLSRRPVPAPAVETPPPPISSEPPPAQSPVLEAPQAESPLPPAAPTRSSPVVPEPPASQADVPALGNVLSTRPPAPRTPEPVALPRAETETGTSEAAVREPAGAPAPAPPAPAASQVQAEPAPLPRAKLTLAPAAAAERSSRPLMAMRRREPEPVVALGEAPVEPVTSPAPSRSLLRRAVDAMFGHEPAVPPDPPAAVEPSLDGSPALPIAAAPRALARAAGDPWEEGAQPSAGAATARPPAGAPAGAGPAVGSPAPAGPVPTPYPNDASGPTEPGGGVEPPSDASGAPVPPAAAPEPVSSPVPLELVEPTGPESSPPAPDAGQVASGGSPEVSDTTSPESGPATGETTPAAGGASPAPHGTRATASGPAAAAPSGTPSAAEEEPATGSSKVARAVMRPFKALSRSAAPAKAGSAPPPGPSTPTPSPASAGAGPSLVQRVAQTPLPSKAGTQASVARTSMTEASGPAAQQDPAPEQGIVPAGAARRRAAGAGSTDESSAVPALDRLGAQAGAVWPAFGGGIPSRAPAPPQVARTAAAAAARSGAGSTSQRSGRPAIRLVSTADRPGSAAVLSGAESTHEQPVPDSLGRRRMPTSGARLAAATGARFAQTDEGFETVEFPRPAGIAFAPAVSLMRADAPAEGSQPAAAEAGQPAAAPAASPAPAPAQAGGGGGGGGDIEEIYTQVIDRLRRELLADRERMGDLLGDLP